MGKKKDKMKLGRIPKEVAGVKLPKAVRKKGEALIAKAASPEGRAALARGLTVAATLANLAVERGKAARPAKPEAATPPPPPGAPPTPAPPLDPQKVAEAVSTVADAVLGRLFPGKKA